MFRAAPSGFGLEVVESSGYVARFASSFDVMMFNRTVGLGLTEPASENVVVSLVQRYREKGVKNFAIQLSPEANPPQLRDWLSNQGLEVRDYWTKMYRSRDPDITIPTDLSVERIDRSLANVFGEVICTVFEVPAAVVPIISATVGTHGWLHYIGWDGTTPAAVGALFVQHDIGWLGIGATLPGFRRRGAQGALMTRRVRDGTSLGCEWFVTETEKDRPEKPNPSFHNMLRCGFVVAYDRPNYMMPPQSDTV